MRLLGLLTLVSLPALCLAWVEDIFLDNSTVVLNLTHGEFEYSVSDDPLPPLFTSDVEVLVNTSRRVLTVSERRTLVGRTEGGRMAIVFATEDGPTEGIFEVHNAEGETHVMHVQRTGGGWVSTDVTSEMLGVVEHFTPQMKKKKGHHKGRQLFQIGYDDNPRSDMVFGPGNFREWFPGCYPNDDVGPLEVDVGVLVDFGGYVRLGESVKGVMDFLELTVGIARVVYFAQMHVVLRVAKVVISVDDTDMAPMNSFPGEGTCPSAHSDFHSLAQKYVNAKGISQEVAIWAIFTDCYPPPGVAGYGGINGFCGVFNMASVQISKAAAWSTLAHEFGHLLGMSHSMQEGGIMSYGSQVLDDVAQFHEVGKTAACATLQRAVLGCPTVRRVASRCGNGVLELDEDCECINYGQEECGNCVDCKLKLDIRCSASDFVVRLPSDPPYVIADESRLSHKDCCQRNQMIPAASACGEEKDGACGSGRCFPICTSASSPDYLGGCGGLNNGCAQACKSRTMGCMADLIQEKGWEEYFKLPDGVACGVEGECMEGVCSEGGAMKVKYCPLVNQITTCQGRDRRGCVGTRFRRQSCVWCGGSGRCVPRSDRRGCTALPSTGDGYAKCIEELPAANDFEDAGV